MLYHVYGELVLTEPGSAVIDCNGVGYKLTVSNTTLSSLPALNTEKKVKLLTHLQVREDGVELFGFYSHEELYAFKLLTSVSGVGPKAAMAILSLLTPEKFALAVTTEDAKSLSRASGVGAKTAARIVLELRDKIAKDFPSFADHSSGVKSSAGGGGFPESKATFSDAQDALLVLGYSRAEAINALRGLDSELPAEELIRAALTKLMKG